MLSTLCARLVASLFPRKPITRRSNPFGIQSSNLSHSHHNLSSFSAVHFPRDVCSTGTHKYVDCPIHVEPGTAANLDLDQGLDYIVFYDITTGESTE